MWLLSLFFHRIQRTARHKPLQLLGVEGMVELNGLRAAILMVQCALHRLAGHQLAQVVEAQAIRFLHQVIVLGVGKGEGQNTLLFQVGLVNPRKAAGNHHPRAQQTGAHGGVLAR